MLPLSLFSDSFDKESNIISKDHWWRGEHQISCHQCIIRFFVCLNCWLFGRSNKKKNLNSKKISIENIFNFYHKFKNNLKYKTLLFFSYLDWNSPNVSESTFTWYLVEYLRVISLGWQNMTQCELSGCKSITPTISKRILIQLIKIRNWLMSKRDMAAF